MQVPYGLELTEDCAKCTERKDGFFCQLPSASLQAMSDVKYTSTYPAGAILYVEGQPSRGVYMLCKGRVKMVVRGITRQCRCKKGPLRIPEVGS